MRRQSVLVALVALAIAPISVPAQQIRQDLVATNGRVRAMVVSGNRLYIGGDFTTVGRATGAAVPIDAATGLEPSTLARVIGTVNAVAQDGSGGWFIGGSFSKVNGVPKVNLAHILADNTVDAWNPGPNGAIYSLVRSGSTIYVAGGFSSIGGQARTLVAGFDATTGTILDWNPSVTGIQVTALAISGSTLYLGGNIFTVGGQSRSLVGAVDATTGSVLPWNPNGAGPFPSGISALAVSGSTVYVCGRFTSIGFQNRSNLAALDAVSGAATTWNPSPNSTVETLKIQGTTLYVGGSFTSIAGQARGRLASFDLSTGGLNNWDPDVWAIAGTSVRAIAVSGSTVYAGGTFSRIGGQARGNLGAVDATTALATSWDPRPDNDVLALEANGSVIFAGGNFGLMGVQGRSRLAEIDLITGGPTSWAPVVGNDPSNTSVLAMALSGSTLYLGGNFGYIAGQPRHNLGAVDVTTGAATAFAVDANSTVRALAINGSTLYVGGAFTGVGADARMFAAAVDATTGAVKPWTPNPNGSSGIFDFAVDGSTVYIGGDFSSIGGQARTGIAALDAVSGNALPWNPGMGGYAIDLLLNGPTLYVGGYFSFAGGAPRTNLAALNTVTASATGWSPDPNHVVSDLALNGSILYVGGNFGMIAGQPRSGLAAVDVNTAFLTPWAPVTGGEIEALAIEGSTIYVGGAFNSINNDPHKNLAGTSEVTVSVPGRTVESNAWGALSVHPNPFRSATKLEFSLAHEARVTVTIHDVAGREVARLANGIYPAGTHEARIDAGRLPSGVYLCRLRTGERSLTKRFVLIP